jgi:hypothetical protein
MGFHAMGCYPLAFFIIAMGTSLEGFPTVNDHVAEMF